WEQELLREILKDNEDYKIDDLLEGDCGESIFILNALRRIEDYVLFIVDIIQNGFDPHPHSLHHKLLFFNPQTKDDNPDKYYEDRFDPHLHNLHHKLLFFNPQTKDNDLDEYYECSGDEIESEYRGLIANQKSSQRTLVDSIPVTSLGNPVEDEFDRYLMLDDQSKFADPIEWWRQHENEFPVMSILARKYLAIPLTRYSLEKSYLEHCRTLETLIKDLPDFDAAKKYKFLQHNGKYLC
ncbi:13436_t:CDS:2, partial [Acaulospora colombiana]